MNDDRTTHDEGRGVLSRSFVFFGRVLDSIRGDNVLRVLWGVIVVLFLILMLMVLFGALSSTGQLTLALTIAVLVAVTFTLSTWRRTNDRAPAAERAPLEEDDDRLTAQAERCAQLLVTIRDANLRIIARAGQGGHWGRLGSDTYNRVCRECHESRLEPAGRDAYLRKICASDDVKVVCDEKWILGEALEDYRNLLADHPHPPRQHVELERLIRRSVVQPDLSPDELAVAVDPAIELARRSSP